MSNTLRIHSFPLSGHGHRVELFASLAGIAHEVITVDLANGEHKGEAFLALNPAGQVPVLEDGDTVTMRGHCDNGEIRIGFGEVSTKLLPAIED